MNRKYKLYEDNGFTNNITVENDGWVGPVEGCCSKKCKITCTLILVPIVILLLVYFLIIPLVVMNSFKIQSLFVFTHFNLPEKEEYFEKFYYPGYKNRYVQVKDLYTNENKSLGVWQILPVELTRKALNNSDYDYDEALTNGNYSIIIYFHGTGESRGDNTRKYQFLSYYFQIIAFDYRSYGDSTKGKLSEAAVVNDCVQLYYWVKNKTQSVVYVWGHSLGSSLATSTVAALERMNVPTEGLILESAFTSLEDELYVHPYSKLFSWLPWFRATFVNPLRRNGFIFDTVTTIKDLNCSIMILHSEDDSIVPYKFGKKLYEVAASRNISQGKTVYYQFEAKQEYDHYFIYQDPFLKFYLMEFIGV